MRALWLALVFLAACSQYNLTGPRGTVDPPQTDTAPPPPPQDTAPPTDTAPPEDTAPPDEPVAVAGPDQQVNPLQTVTLDGSASYDPQGLEPLKYKWHLVSKPQDSTAILLVNNIARPFFWVDVAGTYTFSLTVQNTAGIWDSTPDTVDLVAAPSQDFYVQLSWDASCDLDLHLLDGQGTLFQDPHDCDFCDMHPSWFAAGTADDPSLDWDTISGFGPETTTIHTPAAGVYPIKVHYYGTDGDNYCGSGAGDVCPSTTATVKLFIQGQQVQQWSHTLTSYGEVWNVATVHMPAGTWDTEDTSSHTDLSSCF